MPAKNRWRDLPIVRAPYPQTGAETRRTSIRGCETSYKFDTSSVSVISFSIGVFVMMSEIRELDHGCSVRRGVDLPS